VKTKSLAEPGWSRGRVFAEAVRHWFLSTLTNARLFHKLLAAFIIEELNCNIIIYHQSLVWIFVESFARLLPKPTSIDHPLQQDTGSVLGITSALVEYLLDR
jgi:hypothetical protein